MTKQEFCERVGIHCSDAAFEKFNKEYMASDLDKDAFCKKISKKDIAWAMQWEIIELQKQITALKEQRDEISRHCSRLSDENIKLRATIKTIAEIAKA